MEKLSFLRTWEPSSPKITKKIGSSNSKSAKCHICEKSANLTKCKFTELICGPITFDIR